MHANRNSQKIPKPTKPILDFKKIASKQTQITTATIASLADSNHRLTAWFVTFNAPGTSPALLLAITVLVDGRAVGTNPFADAKRATRQKNLMVN